MVLIGMGDCLPGGSSGLLIEASREEMRDFAKGINLLCKKVVVVADGDTTPQEAQKIADNFNAMVQRYIQLRGRIMGTPGTRYTPKQVLSATSRTTHWWPTSTMRHLTRAFKPDLVLPMKRCWFARIWNGEKTVEYRQVKPYWQRRIGGWVGKRGKFVEMRLGYGRNTPAMLLQVDRIDIGPCPYEGWDGQYYRLHFAVVGCYLRDNGEYLPMLDAPKMKEVGHVST